MVLAIGLAACGRGPSATPPASVAPRASATWAPGDLLRAQGEAEFVSDLIVLDAETTVRIEWAQQARGDFALWLIYEGEADLADPSLYRVLVESAHGQSSGVKEYWLPAGEWGVEVEQSDGPWTLVVKRADEGG